MNSMTHSASPEGLASRLPVLNTKPLSADQRMALAVARIAASRSSLILCLSPNPPEPRRDADGRPMDEPTFVEMLTARINRKGLLHGSWLTARTLLLRKLAGRRSTSRLPELVDLVISRPLVSAGMIAEALAVTPRAALDLVADLDLRETTGRGRFRAWSIL